MTETFHLDDVVDAYQKVANEKVRFRPVIKRYVKYNKAHLKQLGTKGQTYDQLITQLIGLKRK